MKTNCVRTKVEEDKFAFFFVCTKEIANLSSQPRLGSFVFAKFESGLLSHRLIRGNVYFQCMTTGSLYCVTVDGLVNSLLGLFHSTKIIVTIENLYVFFNLKHKHLVICFAVKGIRIKSF